MEGLLEEFFFLMIQSQKYVTLAGKLLSVFSYLYV